MLILLKSIHCESSESNILSYCRMFFCLFNKMYIKLSKMLVYLFNKTCIKLSESADSVKVKLIVNLNSQYAKIRFITDLKS